MTFTVRVLRIAVSFIMQDVCTSCLQLSPQARDANSKAELHAELYLVGLGKEAADIFTGETSEARVLEPQSECPCDVVAQAHTVVDAVACPPIDRRQRRYEGSARV